MIVFLAKVFKKKEYADAFLKGSMHAKQLSYFKKIEGDDNDRGDELEGAILPTLDGLVLTLEGTNPVTGEIVTSITITGEDLVSPVVMIPRWFDRINIFCMYAAQVDEHQEISHGNSSAFKRQLELPDGYTILGEHAVVITNKTEFFRRVKLAASQSGYGVFGNLVSYYDPEIGTPPAHRDIDSIFTKRQEYNWQREFRFVIDTNEVGCGAVTLEIGGIEDIAVYMKTCDINQHLQVQIKPEYIN